MRWIYKENIFAARPARSELREKLGLPDYLVTMLLNRGIDTPDKAAEIFESGSMPFHSPFLFEDMGKAVERINRAIASGEKIAIYGDYDVDGVTSIVILYIFFRDYLKYDRITYYIPHRQDEGYGLNVEALSGLKAGGVSLVITVDCGISAAKEGLYCSEKGIDLIITDHHIPDEGSMPKTACAVINPKVSSKYPYKDLSGAGTAYKLLSALAQERGIKLNDDFLDFVSLGTVADIVPLTGENRMIVRRGLKAIENSRNPGFDALKKVASLKPGSKIDTYHVGFVLGPRINAAGRLDHAKKAVELFLSGSAEEVIATARELNEVNEERKKQMKAAEAEAVEAVKGFFDPGKDMVLVLYNENWNTGIAGLVASKILNKFTRPVFVLAGADEEGVHGSARSLPAVNIHEALKAVSHLLVKFGGHKLAAGVTIKKERIEEFRRAINEYVKSRVKPEEFEQCLEIEDKIGGTMEFKDIKMLEFFSPWGEGNPKPVFVMEGVEVREVRMMKSNTMKFYGEYRGKFYNFLLFGHTENDAGNIKPGEVLDVAFFPKIDEWNGKESLTLEVRDYKPGVYN